MAATVLLVDDHAIVRDGLQLIISSQNDMRVVAGVCDGPAAIAAAKEFCPEVIVMDIAMPGMNGLEAAHEILTLLPATKIIFLTMYESAEHVRQAVKLGACGFLLKKSAGIEIIKAIRTVYKGYPYFGKGVEELQQQYDLSGGGGYESLSSRELQILKLVVDGKTSREIADIICISPKSVETYRGRMMKKLGTDNIARLVKFAIKQGITND